jgi:hypothetical protein
MHNKDIVNDRVLGWITVSLPMIGPFLLMNIKLAFPTWYMKGEIFYLLGKNSIRANTL